LPTRSAEEAGVAPPPDGPALGVAGEGRTAAPGSPAIHTVGLRKVFRGTVAVDALSITVGRGEVFGFLGPNGAGKTTVVKLLLGLVRPTGGEAMVLGAPMGDRETRRRIGYLPELFRFQGWLSAAEVLRLHCRLLELPRHTWQDAAASALDTVGLAARAGDKVATFSKGMQQRLGLGVAMLGSPALVVLDEPTSALDPVGRHDVRQIIRELRQGGATVFLNTHLLEEAEHVCDRVAVIDKGVAVATGSLPELLSRRSSVRLEVDGLGPGWWADLGGFGSWSADDDALRVDDIDPDLVPELVARVVAMGGRVRAVVPEHQSLEARFLELLGEA